MTSADLRTEIDAIESRLGRAGISVAAFCRDAGINKSQWTRWKLHGQRPLHETWVKVRDAAAKVTR